MFTDRPTLPRRKAAVVAGAGVGLTTLLALLIPAVALAGGAVETSIPGAHETGEAVRWGFLIGVGVVVGVALALKPTVHKVIIGADGRLSTSKTIAAMWTFVVAAALLALVYAEALGHGEAFEKTNASGVVGQYALLFGGPLGAAILAKTIVTHQVNQDASVKPPAESTGLSDLVANDAGDTDLGDLQYVLFNLVALVFVLLTMLLHNPSAGLPHIPEVLLGLTSVSAAGYVGKKMLPSEPMSAELAPGKGPNNDLPPVTISVRGLPASTSSPTRFWVKFGPEDKGRFTEPVNVVDGVAAPAIKPEPLAPAPTKAKSLTVTLIPEGGTLLTAGSFEYEP